MRRILCASCLLLSMAAAACARTAPRGPAANGGLPERLAGCYALFDRGGRPASDSTLFFAPPYVRLDTTTLGPARGHASVWTLTRLDADLRPLPEHAFLSWAAAGPDSVRVVFHTGFSGTAMKLQARADSDTLRGRATRHRDYGPPHELDGGPVTAVRVPCRGGAAPGG